jgi:hypothetical protein
LGITILIGIIATAGILGGTANYFMEQSNGAGLRKSILLGLTASATVPLFLKTVSSTLMEDALKGNDISYFVFFGFCTIAALFSSKFLQSLADKLLQDLQDVKQKQEKLSETTNVLVAQNSDPAEPAADSGGGDSGGSEFESFSKSTGPQPALSSSQRVLLALQSGKFAFRTAEGVAQDSGLTKAEALEQLNELEAQGKVLSTRRARDGATVWSIK